MKFLISVFFVSFFSMTSCKKPCQSPEEVKLESVPIMKYFNTYKSSNWWVYQNADKSKKDSIYISDFIESVKFRFKSCVSDSSRLMKLHSTEFLRNAFSSDFYLLIKSTEFFEIIVSFQGVYTTNNIISLTKYKFTTLPISQNNSYEVVPSVILNSSVYTNILVLDGVNGDKYFFAEDLGLVGWHSSNSTSQTTFNLINYKIN